MSQTADTANAYWNESARPLTSLAFVAPLLIVYEAGVLMLGPEAMRNGAEVWLRHLLDTVGFGQYFLLPMLVLLLLLASHHLNRESWRFSPGVLAGMLLESTVAGFLLLMLFQVASALFHGASHTELTTPHMNVASAGTMTRMIGYFGAGIYEELLFRLLLLRGIVGLMRLCGETERASLLAGCLVSSFVFAAAHYRAFTGLGDEFLWSTFSFRFLAGFLFSILLMWRGFGVTAGTHTLYDLLVGMMP